METKQKHALKFTAHPVADVLVPPLSGEQQLVWLQRSGGETALMDYWAEHEGMIKDAAEDPFQHGFELPFWFDFRKLLAEKDEVYALGGNGPGKTEIGGKCAVEKLCEGKGMKVLCISQNENTSKQLQQTAVYKYLPHHAKQSNERAGTRRRGVVVKLNYSQAGGFTEATFVLPNGSQCWFKTVEQFERDPNSFEGPEYDLIWADEPIPLALREALSYRVGKRAGKFLFTFTAVHGYDAICAAILEGAKVVRSLPINFVWQMRTKRELEPPVGAPDIRMAIPELKLTEVQVKGLPAGHMPYIMQPLNKAQGIIFLWTHWNVFLPRGKEDEHVPALFEKCKRKSKATVRTRLYGWTEKLAGSQFPNFNTNIHVIDHQKIVEMLRPKKPIGGRYVPLVTGYMSADPATARSYFLLWMFVDSMKRKFIYDECPRFEEGPWVGEDGDKGDGQMIYAGRGINFVKQLIYHRELEHGIIPVRRFGDPRAFSTAAAAAQGSKDLFALFRETPENAGPDLAPLYFEPAKVMKSLLAEASTGSLDKINDALAYDPDQEITIENEPKMYISDRCQNLIRSVLNWSPEQGDKSPWKDPIDDWRYLFGEELYYIDPGIPAAVGGRGWGASRRN